MRKVGKIVLLEGIDCTGKSTYARRMFDRIQHRVALLHCGPPTTSSAYDEYVRPLLFARHGWTIICDRWHLGEYVWPKIFERTPLYLDVKDMHDVEDNIMSMGIEVEALYFYRDMDAVMKSLIEREEPSYYMPKAVELYEEALQYSHLDWEPTTLPKALADM